MLYSVVITYTTYRAARSEEEIYTLAGGNVQKFMHRLCGKVSRGGSARRKV